MISFNPELILDFGLIIPHIISKLCGIRTSNFSSENFSMCTTMAAPPPLFVEGRVVEMYFKPSIFISFSISKICFFLSFFSHTSVSSPSPISRSWISRAKFLIFGIKDLKLETAMIGNKRLLSNLLSLLIVCLTGTLYCSLGW